ncbi:hypothetical protein V8C86DRAFT_258393 [Haematococcus lacustris]
MQLAYTHSTAIVNSRLVVNRVVGGTPARPAPAHAWKSGRLASRSERHAPERTGGHAHHCSSWTLTSAMTRRDSHVTRASAPEEAPAPANDSALYTAGILLVWAGILAYAFLGAPNQTPYRDLIFLKLLCGLRGPGEEYNVNQVFTALFMLMGVWPCIYACLLIPGGRSQSKLPVWPFVAASFGTGAFALMPYFAFWKPISKPKMPPPKEDMVGWGGVFMKGAETVYLPAAIFLGALSMVLLAAIAGEESWAAYFKLFEESRFVHVTTIDFACLTLFAPFWMNNDAEARKWSARGTLVPLLSVIPILGPAAYLILRPKTNFKA